LSSNEETLPPAAAHEEPAAASAEVASAPTGDSGGAAGSESSAVAEAPPPATEPPPAADPAPAPRPSRGADYESGRAFADFPISPEVLAGIQALGYAMATPVQAMMIDPALAGKDLLVRAKTGTGKTAAFCVPVVERVPAGDRRPRALMLAPTRELAIQVAQECTGIARFKDLRIAAIYGGVGFGPQEQALKDGVEIVVGTPGRVLDHVKRGNLDLSGLQFAVLDEADEMLSMGFLEDVRKILDRAPKERQNILVSATINEGIKGIVRAYLKEPEEIYLSVDGDNVDSIAHILYETSPDYHKARALLDLIELERPASALIFCNTREDVNTVYTFLDRQGLGVEMISGELPQARREKVMARVKAGAVQFLVSTDVAARGIDISGLSHVINYALPEDAAVYLHRCGRTGRIGNTGVAITLAGGGDFSTRLTLERQHKIGFEVKQLPTPEESRRLQADRIARLLKDAGGSMAFEAYIDVVRALRERPDADTLLAIALRGFFQWDRARKAPPPESEEGGAPGGEVRDGGRDRPSRDRGERRDRDDRGDRRDRDERRDRKDREERGERKDREERGERKDREERGERKDREERGERKDREERGERKDREERGERKDREERGERKDRKERGERREDRKERGERKDRPEPTAGEAVPAANEVRPPVVVVADGALPEPASVDGEADEADEADGQETSGDATEGGADGAARKRRRRRRRRSGPRGDAPAAPADPQPE
jgi:ATP-dependent RNA helicase DeaD